MRTETPSATKLKQTESQDSLIERIAKEAESLEDIHNPQFETLIERIGNSKVVLLGESTHGTAEFYTLRAEITKRLCREKGFNIVALEADWPDVEGVNDYVHSRKSGWSGFERFPEWMWRNHQFEKFTQDLRRHNQSERYHAVSIYGLDLYSLASSIAAVKEFLIEHDPEAAKAANLMEDCFHPWSSDPAKYGLAVWRRETAGCRDRVLELLSQLHEERLRKSASDQKLLSAIQNIRIVESAEEYYRVMYEGSVQSWNVRDHHMFETVKNLLDHHGPESKIIVWEHNSHLGNAAATQMARIGEFNVGQLAKDYFGNDCYSVGFMTSTGTVAAASRWDGEVEIQSLRPVREDSFEYLLHEASVRNPKLYGAYLLPLRAGSQELIESLRKPRLERAVGVLYLPESERQSHYFTARLSEQFDEVCWVDRTTAIHPMKHVPEKRKRARSFEPQS